MMDFATLEREALGLDVGDRGRLLSKLVRSFDGISEEENIQIWAEESARRNEEMESGISEGISYEIVMKELREKYS